MDGKRGRPGDQDASPIELAQIMNEIEELQAEMDASGAEPAARRGTSHAPKRLWTKMIAASASLSPSTKIPPPQRLWKRP